MRGGGEAGEEHGPDLDEAEECGAEELEAVHRHGLVLEGQVTLHERRDEVLLEVHIVLASGLHDGLLELRGAAHTAAHDLQTLLLHRVVSLCGVR